MTDKVVGQEEIAKLYAQMTPWARGMLLDIAKAYAQKWPIRKTSQLRLVVGASNVERGSSE